MSRIEVEERLRRLASVSSNAADSSWLLYLAGQGAERDEADDLLDVVLFQRLGIDFRRLPYLDPPSPEVCSGQYPLGTVEYPPGQAYAVFGLNEQEWLRHVLITGMTGAGKTNLVFAIINELQQRDKPFLIFDWKRNYRDLCQLPQFRTLRVHTVARPISPFLFNPLIPPPGTSAGEWLTKLVDVLKHAYFVGEGVEYLLRDAFDWVYDQCGYFSESARRVPLFIHALQYVRKRHAAGRMALWRASALRVLASLCFRHGLGPVLNVAEAPSISQLLEESVVLELDALSDSDKVFLTESLILWIYECRKNQPE